MTARCGEEEEEEEEGGNTWKSAKSTLKVRKRTSLYWKNISEFGTV